MNAPRHQRPRPAQALLLVVAAVGATPALAAGNPPDALARYQQERAVCLSGQSNQDRTTCLREAGAAFAQSKEFREDEAAAQYLANASKRCDRLPGDDKRACIARMQGQGTASGSVSSGGIYRELVTREPASPSAAAPVNSAAPAPTQ
jgi:hypothetical protein